MINSLNVENRGTVVCILTSRHDVAYVLHSKSRVLVLCVDTNHSMT